MQCLEGPAEQVTAIYKKILVDRRHHDIRLLVCEARNVLMFETWSMIGLSIKPLNTVSSNAMAYTLLDHRLYRPWKSLGLGAADLIYEYAKVKSELEKAGELDLLDKVFDVYPG
jgi:Sensors of blue-light using FAD